MMSEVGMGVGGTVAVAAVVSVGVNLRPLEVSTIGSTVGSLVGGELRLATSMVVGESLGGSLSGGRPRAPS